MPEKKCEDCGTVYRIIPEITDAGGKVWNFGAALVGRCGCGCNLGSVGLLWRKIKDEKVTPDK